MQLLEKSVFFLFLDFAVVQHVSIFDLCIGDKTVMRGYLEVLLDKWVFYTCKLSFVRF